MPPAAIRRLSHARPLRVRRGRTACVLGWAGSWCSTARGGPRKGPFYGCSAAILSHTARSYPRGVGARYDAPPMIKLSPDPQVAEQQIEAIIFYLTTCGYIDSE